MFFFAPILRGEREVFFCRKSAKIKSFLGPLKVPKITVIFSAICLAFTPIHDVKMASDRKQK
jgi:hypothetical protein